MVIPSSITTVEHAAFASIKSTSENGTLKIGLVNIPANFFVATFKNLILDNTVRTIGTYAFGGSSFGNITFPEGIEEIPDKAFSGASFTGDLTIPSSVQTIGDQAFAGCGFDGKITINEGVKNIKGSAFGGCYFKGELRIPKSVTSIEAGAFYSCSSLTKSYFGK